MATESKLLEHIPEKGTAKITSLLTDENGGGIDVANITTLTLTLYDEVKNTIINSKDGTDIKNLNGGTLDASGNFTLTLAILDNIIVGTAAEEVHIALVEWTYSTGTKGGNHKFILTVENRKRIL